MNKEKAGVVVCRFQVPTLHEGHLYLLDTVKEREGKILVLIGVNPGWTSKQNPLDFPTRKAMVLKSYPDAIVMKIEDNPSDEFWSQTLDTIIEENLPEHDVTLYGSRESFLPYYKGKFSREYLSPLELAPSGTLLRELATREVLDSEDFRTGAIYAATRQNFPTSFQVVDVVIRHSTEPKVLVGRKPGEKEWRFPGGFVDPIDGSLESAVRREARQEVGDIEMADVKYVASVRIDDSRYRNSEHKVMSAFFSAVYVFGHIMAGDDLAEVKWVSFDELQGSLMPAHAKLGELFLKSIANTKN